MGIKYSTMNVYTYKNGGTMTLEQAKEKAEKLSSGLLIPIFLYSYDMGDGNAVYSCTASESFLHSEEFKEVNGLAIAEFYQGNEC
jgi:hypothetical protein